jgi:hypothetical protein
METIQRKYLKGYKPKGKKANEDVDFLKRIASRIAKYEEDFPSGDFPFYDCGGNDDLGRPKICFKPGLAKIVFEGINTSPRRVPVHSSHTPTVRCGRQVFSFTDFTGESDPIIDPPEGLVDILPPVSYAKATPEEGILEVGNYVTGWFEAVESFGYKLRSTSAALSTRYCHFDGKEKIVRAEVRLNGYVGYGGLGAAGSTSNGGAFILLELHAEQEDGNMIEPDRQLIYWGSGSYSGTIVDLMALAELELPANDPSIVSLTLKLTAITYQPKDEISASVIDFEGLTGDAFLNRSSGGMELLNFEVRDKNCIATTDIRAHRS